MGKKLLLLALMSILVIALPLVIAQIAQSTQSIHVTGTGTYPNNPAPTSSPSAAPASAVKFSLWFQNGTQFPASISGNSLYVFVAGSTDLSFGRYTPNAVVIRNDGTVPLTAAVSSSNVNLPSNLQLEMSDVKSVADGQTVIEPGQNATIQLVILLVLQNTQYTSGASFSYSFDIGITASEAA